MVKEGIIIVLSFGGGGDIICCRLFPLVISESWGFTVMFGFKSPIWRLLSDNIFRGVL